MEEIRTNVVDGDFPEKLIVNIINQGRIQCERDADYASGLRKSLEAFEIFSDSLASGDFPAPVYSDSLEQILGFMRFVYRAARPSIGFRDLDGNFINCLREKISQNGKVAQIFMEKLLCPGSSHHYDRNGLGTRLSNDLLFLTVKLGKTMDEDTARKILSFIPIVTNDLALQPYPESYQISVRWREILNSAMKVATNLTDPHHLLALGWGGGTFCYAATQADQKKIAEWCKSNWNNYPNQHAFLENCSETEFSLCGTTIKHNGVRVGYNHTAYTKWCLDLFKAVGTETTFDTVVEVGTGFGAFARLLRDSGKFKSYILVDIPEALTFSYAYIVANFPKAKTHVIRSKSDIYEGMTKDFDFIFCPIQKICSLDGLEVDLVVNNWSLGEMRQECADYIVSAIENNIKPRYFYSVNMIFQDKELDLASGYKENAEDNNNLAALNVSAMWKPIYFLMMPSIVDDARHGKIYMSSVATVIERTPPEKQGDLIPQFVSMAAATQYGSADWLKYMYFVALWTTSVGQIEEFLKGLFVFFEKAGISALDVFDFEKVGEVMHLRKRIETLKRCQ